LKLVEGLPWAFKPKFLYQPVRIVSIHEVCNRDPELLDVVVLATVDNLFFESSIEPFRTPLISGSATNAKLGAYPST